MYTPMSPTVMIVTILMTILDIYMWVVIAAVVMSWLIAFNVVNTYNKAVRIIMQILDRLTEPVFRLVRRIIPPIGGLDLSPIVIFFAIWILQVFVVPLFGNLLFRLIG
jgi:YggT family protein